MAEATAVEEAAAVVMGEDATDLDPGSAIATVTATAIGTEEGGGAALTDGIETALHAMGTAAAEEEVEAEETGGTSCIVRRQVEQPTGENDRRKMDCSLVAFDLHSRAYRSFLM